MLCPRIAITLVAMFAASSARAQTTWYVDDNAPSDPGQGDPTVSDPNEDGSPEHPFDAIQEGISAAVNGDTVLVLDGTYTGTGNKNLDYGGKLITVRSENDPSNCIIDCEDSGRGFHVHYGETDAAVVEGFTITNGNAEDGGAILCEASNLRILNCTITGNSALDGLGGGICCRYLSTPTVADCAITGNIAANGGGVYCADSCDATISNCSILGNATQGPEWESPSGGGVACVGNAPRISQCDISGNTVAASAHGGAWGGGVCFYDGAATLIACSITGNAAQIPPGPGHAMGGGVYVYNCDAMILDCTIADNTVTYNGGGLLLNASSATVTNCTITGNTATGSYAYAGGIGLVGCTDTTITNCRITANTVAGDGGGVYYHLPDTAFTIANCTITENEASGSGGGVCAWGAADTTITSCILWADMASQGPEIALADCGPPSTTTVSYSDVQGGEAAVYKVADCLLNWGPGNIDAYALFADPSNGDYHLSAGSPCIDAGCNCGVPVDTADIDDDGDTDEPTPLDLEGEGRFFDDPATGDTGSGCVPIVDMGAYEFGDTGPQPCVGDLDCNHVVNLSDLAELLANYGTASGANHDDGDLDCDGDVELPDLAVLLAGYGTTCP